MTCWQIILLAVIAPVLLLFVASVWNTAADAILGSAPVRKPAKPIPKWVWWIVGVLVAAAMVCLATQCGAGFSIVMAIALFVVVIAVKESVE